MAQKLSANFMAELFKLIYSDISLTRIAVCNLTYQLIPKEWPGYKYLLREAIETFTKNEVVPSLGVVSQKYIDNDFVQETIVEIQDAQKVDREIIIDQLEAYIKDVEFQLLSKKVHDLYEEGKKDDAIRVNLEESQRILSISLRHDGGNFSKVFNGFERRMRSRRENIENSKLPDKITLGIDKIDDVSYGGALIEDTILWIARSGEGKSTVLKHHAMCAALDGYPVLHIQLEGGVKACLDKYDQYWTGQEFNDIRRGFLKPEDQRKVMNAYKSMRDFGEDITVYGFEKFGEASMVEVRNIIIDYHKVYGCYPKVLVLDSLDLVKTGVNNTIDNNPNFKKDKLQTNAQLFKNLCVEFKMIGFTATQASNVPIEIWDNSDKIIDRSYTEGDKTLVKPFSFVFTINRTREEKKQQTMRVYIDKLRDYKEAQITIPIATDYDRGRFYDKLRTLELFNDNNIEKPKQDEKEKPEKLKRFKKY
jgi:replicative DNA helicase